jgi:hypothetical protein
MDGRHATGEQRALDDVRRITRQKDIFRAGRGSTSRNDRFESFRDRQVTRTSPYKALGKRRAGEYIG